MSEVLEKQELQSRFKLTDVTKKLKDGGDLGYVTRFSFDPFIKEMSGMVKNGCKYTQSTVEPILKKYSEYLKKDTSSIDEMKNSHEFQTLVRMVIPSMFQRDNLSFISSPFAKDILVSTEALKNILEGEEWELIIDNDDLHQIAKGNRKKLYTFILDRFYDQDLSDSKTIVLNLYNTKTKIHKHYQILVSTDFIEAKVVGDLPDLSQGEINHLLNNLDNHGLWSKYFPTEMFEFYGFALGQWADITEVETLAELKYVINTIEGDRKPSDFLEFLSTRLRAYLGKEHLTVGLVVVDEKIQYKMESLSLTGLSGDEITKVLATAENGGSYGQVIETRENVLCEHIALLSDGNELDDLLATRGYQSVILHPVYDDDGDLVNIVEICSKKAYDFNSVVVAKIKKVLNLLDGSYGNYVKHLENRVSQIIQEKFTSIHPSVEWKFDEIATDYFVHIMEGRDVEIGAIVFENLMPLFGQSDIVGSSKIRNTSIQNDLLENLALALNLVNVWLEQKDLHILHKFKIEIERTISRIKENYTSQDESSVIKLISEELNPVFYDFSERYDDLDKEAYASYISHLDTGLNIVYRERKSFEESVAKLNIGISSFLDAEDEKLQKVLPHFFEKYKTDGVEYNMYLGQSILQSGNFSQYDVKEFRIWQLANMCKIARFVEELRPTLDIPLNTAQLIFVYNNPISIRFRMDEKRFDVDGTYNVRYEILKKRIDKAVVKGTDERLTIAGKIAIVYLSEADKTEYLDYIDYLIGRDYIDSNVEDLELEKMQGADGLKALRITVKNN